MTEDQVMERQDSVDNAIHRLLSELAHRPLAWDMSLIGDVRDCIEVAFEKRGIMTTEEFYPSFPEEEGDEEEDDEEESQ